MTYLSIYIRRHEDHKYHKGGHYINKGAAEKLSYRARAVSDITDYFVNPLKEVVISTTFPFTSAAEVAVQKLPARGNSQGFRPYFAVYPESILIRTLYHL